jgi:hypothetical protein
MADATRLPQGIIIEVDIATVASPVDTIVRDTTSGELYVSTNATVPTYTQLTGTGSLITTPWTDISGDLVAALQAFPGFPPMYRVVGDEVQMRGIVEVITGTQNFPYTLFSNFPAQGGTIPAGLEPGAGSHIAPAVFSNDTFVTGFTGRIGVSNKVSLSGSGGTGVPTAWDVVVLDGISWSVTA